MTIRECAFLTFLFIPLRKPTSTPLDRLLPPEGGKMPPTAAFPIWGEWRWESTPFSPYRHFEQMREIFFVRGQAKDVRIAASGKHRASRESEGRCFMQTALRKKTETGNEKDPSAALGSPFQGKGLAWTLPPSFGRRCPEGAEVGWGWRCEKERGNASQVRRLRKHPIHRWRGPPSPMGKAAIRECRFPHIVISSESEKSFSFAVRQRM